jgi:hypothetical protein
MGSLGTIVNPTLDFLRNGFEQINTIQGIVIALFAVVLMQRWRQLPIIVLGAWIVNYIVDQLRPMVASGGMNLSQIKLPHVMDAAFWIDAVSSYAGLLIVVAMFFAVKSVLFRRGGGAKAKAHG